MEGLRRHLSYANVMATLAVLIAIGGGTTAIAVSKGGKKADVSNRGVIRTGRVTTPKLANGAVTAPKLANGNVTSADLAGVKLVEAIGRTPEAVCPYGDRLLSGGAISLTTGVPLEGSFPNKAGTGWIATGGSGSAVIKVVAVCLSTIGP